MSKSVAPQNHTKTSIIYYTVGFFLSVALTLVAFLLVFQHISTQHANHSHQVITIALFGFAVTQLAVQLVFFLHLGQEKRTRWNLISFLFMLIVLVIVVFGSLWIMDNLNYHMMSPQETKDYMEKHQGF